MPETGEASARGRGTRPGGIPTRTAGGDTDGPPDRKTRANVTWSSDSKAFHVMRTDSRGVKDLYFGDKAPEGKEKNWLSTPKGKGYFVILRLYGPLEPALDRTWIPGDIEKVK